MRMAAQKRPWAGAELRAEGAFDALLHRLWFDTHVHDAASLELLTQHVNGDRLVFGTNFSGWDQQDYNVRQEAKPYTQNAQRLLRAGATS
jgi:aminocarboxymuconate-semialdehyde decarboxylase